MRCICLTLVVAALTSPTVAAEGLAEAATVILDDSEPTERREELIARHKDDAAGLLRHLTAGLKPGTPEELRRIPWIWRVTVAAGKRNDAAELAAILDASLPEPRGRLHEWQAVVIGGGVINGIGLAGGWPGERIDALLRTRPELRTRWNAALEQATSMVDDEQVIAGTRYDALRMVALRDWKTARPLLERYLGHENAELQQGAVSGLSDVRSAEAPVLLLTSLDRLSDANRQLALDALVRDASRMQLTLDNLERGTLTLETLGESRLRRLQNADDAKVKERALRLR